MKKRIRLLKLMLLLLLMGCCKTEILNAPKLSIEQADTIKRVVRTQTDTTRIDEPRVPMGFNPSVQDWEEMESDL